MSSTRNPSNPWNLANPPKVALPPEIAALTGDEARRQLATARRQLLERDKRLEEHRLYKDELQELWFAMVTSKVRHGGDPATKSLLEVIWQRRCHLAHRVKLRHAYDAVQSQICDKPGIAQSAKQVLRTWVAKQSWSTRGMTLESAVIAHGDELFLDFVAEQEENERLALNNT